MSKKLKIYTFPGSEAPIQEVGGKAFSLLKGSSSGLPVPPGFVLPVVFFTDWLKELKKTDEWDAFLKSSAADLRLGCDVLKQRAMKSIFSVAQQEAIDNALADFENASVFAVRSSSPEEDLEGTSFAGGYETILGVTRETMLDAVRRAFASCLDIRIVTYKKEHGFDITNPKIAIVVQQQIASEVSGVGFSLNPVTNDYDEAVFNANWGLGETVVGGLVTPDSFTVNKISFDIVERSKGTKELSIWLKKKGGTEEKKSYKSDEWSLSDRQVIELTRLIKSVEVLYGKPIDTEWAFSKDKLYLLQARPITAYMPLPSDMVTNPGRRKRLYLDATISVQGIYKPMSPMGTSIIKRFLGHGSQQVIGKNVCSDITTSLPWVTQGRLYINVSNALELAGKEKLANFLNNMDPLAADIIRRIDESEYRSGNSQMRRPGPGLLLTLPKIASATLSARVSPRHFQHECEKNFAKLREQIVHLSEQDLPVMFLADNLMRTIFSTVLRNSMPAMIASRLSLQKMKEKASAFADKEELDKLELALPHNVTTEMGLALADAADQLPDGIDIEELARGIAGRSLPEGFLTQWDQFLFKYGHRGAVEIDAAAPRYRENPRLLLDLLVSMKGRDTRKRFEENQAERTRAFERMLDKVKTSFGTLAAERFKAKYRVVENLGGYRETHKYYLVMVVDLLRRRLLAEGERLFEAKRLESPQQIFDLTLNELETGTRNPSYDLIEAARRNRALVSRLESVPQLPTVIDSRGKILRTPPPVAEEGVVVGIPISAGVARGRVKVMHAPDEKTLEKGEILVARATDPGWTPLFINASAVVLEVGGVLQHGALVAREYGLPCVAGITGATKIWTDGTYVEVDGSAGVIRNLAE